jgi:hypothetical protein
MWPLRSEPHRSVGLRLLGAEQRGAGVRAKKKSKAMCVGCYNDDYNHGLGGAKECWSYESAVIIKRLAIPVDRSPPYDPKSAEPTMSCYRKQRWVYVKPEVLDDSGYWRR